MSSSAIVIGFPDLAHKILRQGQQCPLAKKSDPGCDNANLSILYTDHHSRRLYSLVVSSSEGSDISWWSPSDIAILSASPIYKII
jgi:hypothetical protein